MTTTRAPALLLAVLLLPACGDDDDAEPAAPGGPSPEDQARLLGVEQTEEWTLPGLTEEVHVVRTEAGVPRLYAHDRSDLARVLGFVVSRDRYFVMDLQRRLGLGTLTELLGDVALENDLEARQLGMTHTAQRLHDHLTSEQAAYLDAFAGGVNTFIDLVRAGDLPAPAELALAAPLLGADAPVDLMAPWDRLSVAAMVAVVMYETNFEKDDIGRTRDEARLATLFEGAAFGELRREGARVDLWEDVRPLFPYSSAAGLGLDRDGEAVPAPSGKPRSRAGLRLPPGLLEGAGARLDRFVRRLRGEASDSFGSNAWAVAGSHSKDGAALLAGDGHLSLTVPGYMYQVGLDTRVFGGGDTHQAGLLITGLPMLAVGTNGRVAWSMVNPKLDITDWYREELDLDESGRPATSRFQGEDRPLVEAEDSFVVADVAVLGSTGRTETWARWTTFDGRWIVDIEGREVGTDYEPAAGETVVNLQGTKKVPGDTDDDGVIVGLSFDHASLDTTGWISAVDGFGFADDVEGFREATKALVGGGLFNAVADADGSVLFTSYQAVPCRTYLPREGGRWTEGADPMRILDGTRYGGFTLPTGEDGRIDEGPGADDPYRCAVPFDEMPQAIDPPAGFVATANNDPGNLATDGSLDDDRWYIGGPWYSARVDSISGALEEAVEAGSADVAKMAEIQAHSASRLGELFAPALVQAVERAEALAGGADLEPHEVRLAELYSAHADAFDEAAGRLAAWQERGNRTPSGVETFYHVPEPGDGADSVATMLFNAWLPRAMQRVFDDEQLPWVWSSSVQKSCALRRFLSARGGDGASLASHNRQTGEAVFFDVLGTDEVERSDEVLLLALADALTFLAGPAEDAATGGFGTDDMDRWLWGMRHQVTFKSLLVDVLGDDPMIASVFERFSITTKVLPLADDLSPADPRGRLKWFPRPGDNFGVDAANPGFSGTRFTHGSGAVMRMVIGLSPDGVTGRNVIPGGQSADPDSPHFADQAALWLSHEALPLRFHVEEVVAGAVGREVYGPED